MKRSIVAVLFAIAAGSMGVMIGEGIAVAVPSGEALFKQHCAVCHVDGGNIINPKKTLHKADRDANAIKSADAIIKIMRNPGPGMTKFDEKTIPGSEAKLIADYILKTFK